MRVLNVTSLLANIASRGVSLMRQKESDPADVIDEQPVTMASVPISTVKK